MVDTELPHVGAKLIRAVLERRDPAIVQYDRELLSAHPAGYIERTAREGVQRCRHALQCQIAGLMPVTIIVTLEEIDIEQQQADRHVFPASLLANRLKLLVKAAPIGEPCQRIAQRLLLEKAAQEKLLPMRTFPEITAGRREDQRQNEHGTELLPLQLHRQQRIS